MTRERARWPLLLGVAVVVFAIDQLTKTWAVDNLQTRMVDIVGSLRGRDGDSDAGEQLLQAQRNAVALGPS